MKNKPYISINRFKDIFSDIPDRYFQKLEEGILQQTIHKAELKEKLITYLHTKPASFEAFEVNDAYFDSLSQAIENRLFQNSILWPALKKEFITAPSEAYFDELSSKIITKATIKNNRVVKRDWIPSIVKQPEYATYAIAAVISCMVVGLAYFKFGRDIFPAEAKWTVAMNGLSKQEIASYISSQAHDEIEAGNLSATNWETDLSKAKWDEADVNNMILTDEL